MKRGGIIILVGVLGLLALLLAGSAGAFPPERPNAQGGAPTLISYQGLVKVDGAAFTGTGQFKFAIVNGAGDTTYWSNDGTSVGGSEPTASVSLSVGDGLFNVLLGDTSLGGMSEALGASVFSDTDRYLRIWFNDGSTGFQQLSPDQRIASVPYALNADTVDGHDASAFAPASHTHSGSEYQNVIIVAKSGGDFTSIQAALDSIADNSDTNRYLVWVAPGTYAEKVTMKQYVDIEGSGELVTKIRAAGSVTPQDTGTVVGANNAELRFLTVENTGGDAYAVAIYNSSASPRLTHVTAMASGGSPEKYGVYNYDSSSPTMTHVIASVSGGSSTNCGVMNYLYSSPTMTNVTATASGGDENLAVYNLLYSSPTMTSVTATASGGTRSCGVYNRWSSATIQNSAISASGGTDDNYGIYNYAESGSHTVKVDNSRITGSTATILNDSEFATYVGASLLDGGDVYTGGGTVTCAGVYDENYTFYASTCP